MIKHLIAVGCTLAVVGLSLGVDAATVISRSGAAAGGGGLSIAYQYGADQYSSVLAVGWTQTLGFTDVTITAPFGVGDFRQFAANAFLTRSIGPGTTVSDQVATTTFPIPTSFAGTPYPDVTLFTGLTLDPGTYYLTVIGTPGSTGGWGNTGSPVATSEDPGATMLPVSGLYYLSNDGRPGMGHDPAAYAPASAFIVNDNIPQYPLFTVTGTVIPEPSAVVFFSIGLGLALVSRRAYKAA